DHHIFVKFHLPDGDRPVVSRGPKVVPGLANKHEELSQREREVLVLLAQGHTNQQAANRLFLSVKTVETYRARIGEKLGLRGRANLVRYAVEMGLLGPGPASLPQLGPASLTAKGPCFP